MINHINRIMMMATPANKEHAGPIPRLVKNAWPKSGKTDAITERKSVLPARIDAAYCG